MKYGPTEEAIKIRDYIIRKWGKHFRVGLEVPFQEFLPKPTTRRLLNIWEYACVDILVQSKSGNVCVIEPGGYYHFKDEKTIKNDVLRDKLCALNRLRTFRLCNGMMENIPKREWRKLVGGYLFKNQIL